MAFEYQWWEYFLIPWIAGFVGFITNVLALQLTFYPLEYFGIELFRLKGEPWGIIGWQGASRRNRHHVDFLAPMFVQSNLTFDAFHHAAKQRHYSHQSRKNGKSVF
jgi:hypothetical protein